MAEEAESVVWGSELSSCDLSGAPLALYDSFTRCVGDVELFHVAVGDAVFVNGRIAVALNLFNFDGLDGIEVRLYTRARDISGGARPYHGTAEVLLSTCFAVVPISMVDGICSLRALGDFIQEQCFDEDRFYVSAAEYAGSSSSISPCSTTYVSAGGLPPTLVNASTGREVAEACAVYLRKCLEETALAEWNGTVHLLTLANLRELARMQSILHRWSLTDCSREQLGLPAAPLVPDQSVSDVAHPVEPSQPSLPPPRTPSPPKRLTRSTQAASPRKRVVVEDESDEEGTLASTVTDGDSPIRRSRRIPRARKDKKKILQQRIDHMTQERVTVLGTKRARVIVDEEEEEDDVAELPLDSTPSPKKVTKRSEMSWMEQVEQGMQPEGLELQETCRLQSDNSQDTQRSHDKGLRAGELIRELKERKSPVRVKLKQSLLPVLRVKADGGVAEEDEDMVEPVVVRGVAGASRLRKRKAGTPNKKIADLLFDSDDEPLCPKQATLAFERTEAFADSDCSLDGFIVSDNDVEEVPSELSDEGGKKKRKRRSASPKSQASSLRSPKRPRSAFPEVEEEFQLRKVFTLKQAMGVYIQYLATCILDPDFAEDLRQQPREGYYTPAKDKIEHAVRYRKNSLISSQAWHVSFRKSMQKHAESGHTATFEVSLEGLIYDSEALWDARLSPFDVIALYESGASRNDDPQLYKLGKHCKYRTRLWHQLHHYKLHLILKVRRRLKALDDLDPVDALKALIDDERFVTQQFDALLTTINDCDNFGTEDSKR